MNYDELVQRLRDSQHNNIIAGWEGDARDDREAADAITKLRAERDDFYSDYRMKCDKETKALTVERDALRALLRELDETWIRSTCPQSIRDSIDAALKGKP